MKVILILLFCLHANCLFAQISAIILDNSTNKAIAYVNIWIEDKNSGTTSDKLGHFHLPHITNTDVILFSAIGYQTKKIRATEVGNEIRLQPTTTILNDVVISPISKKQKVSRFKKRGINRYCGSSKMPQMIARYFKYEEKYSETPYLKSITLLTLNRVDNALFNLRLYSVDHNGMPHESLHSDNIVCHSNKGNRKTVIELSNLNIQFPLKGFFVAVEWLIIDENKYVLSFHDRQYHQKINIEHYSPDFGTLPFDSNKDLWIYSKGKWKKPPINRSEIKKYDHKYSGLAVELELEN